MEYGQDVQHIPFEDKLLPCWYLFFATYKVKPDSILGFLVHFSQLSVAGTKESNFHRVRETHVEDEC